MGKIFDALEKFAKESGYVKPNAIRQSDYEILMKFDYASGKLKVDSAPGSRDHRRLQRLMTYRLVREDGTLTPAGRAKYEEIKRRHQDPVPPKSETPPRVEGQTPLEIPAVKPPVLAASDWAILMKYDRKSGNLLTYDPGTGWLDQNSTAILKDPVIIQRLIDAGMILPGGWLTPKAKGECARIEQRLKRKQIKGSAKPEITAATNKTAQPSETLGQTDLDVLLQCDPKTRQLDLNSAAIANNPGIVRRLVANKIITPDGRLTPKGILNWQVLTRWSPAGDEKAPAAGGQKQSIAGKMPKVADKTQPTASSGESGQKKVKIINFDNDGQPVKKKAEEVQAKDLSAPAHKTPFAAPKPDRSRKKDDLQIPRQAAPVAGPHRSTVGGRFSRGKTTVGYNKKAMDPDLVSLLDPQSFEAEQFKILRTNLLFSDSGKAPRSVMVTSAVPGEGKSFVASNLAISVARHVNWNVLLIDCDLRRPTVHRQFGFQETPGLSDYLSRGVSLESLLLKTCVDNLTILPGGRLPDNPSEILSSDRMSALLDEAATRYDDRLIILDSPPPRLAAETGALARLVDGIILVVKHGSTSRKIVSDLIDKLDRDKLLGAIINNFDMRFSTYSAYHYRY